MTGVFRDTTDAVENWLARLVLAQRSDTSAAHDLLHEPADGWSASLSASQPQRVLRHLALAQLLIDEGEWEEAEALLKGNSHHFAHEQTIPGSYFIGVADGVMGSLLAAKGSTSEAEFYLQVCSIIFVRREEIRIRSRKRHGQFCRRTIDSPAVPARPNAPSQIRNLFLCAGPTNL